MTKAISRRDFIKATSVTAIGLPFAISLGSRKAHAFATKAPAVGDARFVSAFIQIGTDNKTTLFVGSAEMGQGITTGLAQLAAEELKLEWSETWNTPNSINVAQGSPGLVLDLRDKKGDYIYNALNWATGVNYPGNPFGIPMFNYFEFTGGSTSMMHWYGYNDGNRTYPGIRDAAYSLRQMLIFAAGEDGGTWEVAGNSQLKRAGQPNKNYSDLVVRVHEIFFSGYYDNNNNFVPRLPIPTASSPSDLAEPKDFVGKDKIRLDLKSKVYPTTQFPPPKNPLHKNLNGERVGLAEFGIDIKKSTRSRLQDKSIGEIVGTQFYYGAVVHAPKLGWECNLGPAVDGNNVFALYNARNACDAIGVLSTLGTYEAFQAAKSLSTKLSWSFKQNIAPFTYDSLYDSAKIKTRALQLAANESLNADSSPKLFVANGSDYTGARSKFEEIGAVRIDQTYSLPNLAHACMEVLNCTVLIRKNGEQKLECEIWVPTQTAETCFGTAKAILGSEAIVQINGTLLGGGLGRKFDQDYVSQALQLAFAKFKKNNESPTAVKLVWQREQDFTNDKYRPSSVIRIRMSAKSGALQAYIHRTVAPVIGAGEVANPEATGDLAGAFGIPYAFSVKSLENAAVPNQIPLGYWRSVGESYNTFAIESAMDELARASAQTSYLQSIDFRLSNIPDTNSESNKRSRAVLTKLRAETLNFGLTTGTAGGMAFLSGFGSYVALALEVSGTYTSMQIRRAVYVLDCGLRVNENAIRAQMQGGFLHGLSAALWGKMTFSSGVPSAANFDRYRLARMSESPKVTVVFANKDNVADNLQNQTFYPPGGVGETPVPVVAPALANAFARLTGTRKRDLPLI